MKLVSGAKLVSRAFCALVALVTLLNFPSHSFAEEYETLTELPTAQVAPAALLSGPHHSLAPITQSDGYMNTYTVQSEFGNSSVTSNVYLQKYIEELSIIAYLKKEYGSIDVATEAAGETAKNIVTAPIRGAEKLYDTVSDTEKLKKTAKSVPKGVANLFSLAADTASSAATTVYKAGKSAVSGSSSGESSGESSIDLGKAADFVTDKTLDYIGYNDAYRDLAKELRVDPYTGNELLKSELKRVASIQSSVHVAGKFAPGIGGIPGVGKANRYLGYASDAALYEDPKEVDALNKKILDTMDSVSDAVGGSSTEEEKEAFFTNEYYTPVSRRIVIDSLKKLEKVPNVATLLAAAGKAKSREVALFYLLALGELAQQQEQGKVWRTIVPNSILPAAVSSNNELMLPLPVDYLMWTEDVARILRGFRDSIDPALGVTSTTILVAGKVSPRCKDELFKLKAHTIFENYSFLS